jgi:6-phosphogluconolactonase (cycloisomerase 2 family)
MYSDSISVFVFGLEGTLKMEAVCSVEALDPSAGPRRVKFYSQERVAA